MHTIRLHQTRFPNDEDDIEGQDDRYIARRMNEELEALVSPTPEQYTWILKLLKTRKEGEIEPYARENILD
jgi:lauroyl-Kdo2-lipid IVA myristoyltransferase